MKYSKHSILAITLAAFALSSTAFAAGGPGGPGRIEPGDNERTVRTSPARAGADVALVNEVGDALKNGYQVVGRQVIGVGGNEIFGRIIAKVTLRNASGDTKEVTALGVYTTAGSIGLELEGIQATAGTCFAGVLAAGKWPVLSQGVCQL